jgi:hypothetical protein
VGIDRAHRHRVLARAGRPLAGGAYLVSPERLGTAYGLMTMLQNIGMMLAGAPER